jgi:hypothetical protein
MIMEDTTVSTSLLLLSLHDTLKTGSCTTDCQYVSQTVMMIYCCKVEAQKLKKAWRELLQRCPTVSQLRNVDATSTNKNNIRHLRKH